ncbi:oligopeptide ABC transporter substrate-binding protein [Alteribacter lacisalsi]|jgi:peptide/nickel transport system substrate-binding protein|uniref:Oligopeptide ABC transporter substrate-binding protein n=1 Tax=Alteribacter lacisalsi TaxID=2045244 RepID=A0A2W0H454_9BACI|nr:oligopeptide ABC transporter substrate-binding protein [Alteribacter lacisalsi]PYZ95386.1 oligopeptide ABC transporter substrate-binding protein [Alteribacter lacisalsi]
MKKSLLLLLAMLLSISILVVACGGDEEEPADTDTDTDEQDADGGDEDADGDADEEEEVSQEDAPQGGSVTYGYTQPFAGVFDIAHYGGQDDAIALGIMTEGLVDTDDELLPEPNLATWDEDGTTITFHIEEGVYWHNGEELTAEDMAYAWQVIAHPDYTGTRQSNVAMIVGAQEVMDLEDYDAEATHELEGVTIVDDHTLEVEVVAEAPNTLSNLWTNPIPKAHYEGIAVADLEESDEVRRNPVGLGPFEVANIVPGEQVEFTAYEDYWKGRPNLDEVIYRIIDGEMAGELIQQGEVDLIDLPPSQAVDLEGVEGVTLEEIEALSYSYIGFKLGHWDGEQNVMDNDKFADKNVRHAFAHAIDRQGIIDAFSEGYGTVINAPESVISWAYPDESTLNQYEYDPERAMELLDEAGFEDVTGDGFRENSDGEEFTVNFMAMSGTDIAEPRATYIVQNLQDVGINAQLQDGQLFEFNLFYDLVEEDDADIDLFMGAWGLAADPDPTGLWRTNDFWNFPRWVNEESEELIERGLSEEAMDIDYRAEVYQEWHQLVNEELPLIPLNSPVDVYAINSEVGGITVGVRDATDDAHLWYREQ